MDKYEYRIKAEQIVKLVGRKKYTSAMKIADDIDWNRVKNVQMLCTVSDVYEKNEKYEDAREILYLAYDRSPADRIIVYKISELSLVLGDIKEAINYFREYTQLAPNDTNVYILKYKLYVANNANLETLISVLEELKEQDFHEEWGFELARLYAQAGYIEQCVELCDELDLWFNDGPYVMQALELKQNYEELTEVQKLKLEQSYSMLNQAEDLEKIMEDSNPREPEAEQEEYYPEEEDIFFAGNVEEPEEESALEEEETEDSDEDEGLEEIGENDNHLEYYADDEAEEEDEEEEENKKSKGHSGGVLSKLGRFGKMLVEPAMDYDLEEDEEEENDEEEVAEEKIEEPVEELPQPEKTEEPQPDSEPAPKKKLRKKQETKKRQEIMKDSKKNNQTDLSKFLNPGYFDLGRLAANQEVDEKKIAEYENELSAPKEIQRENITQEINISGYRSTEKDENDENPQAVREEQENDLENRDTKPFNKATFKSGEDKSQYRKKMESALRNLDKVVNVEMNVQAPEEKPVSEEKEDNDDINDIIGEKELRRENSETVTPVWNGVSRYDTMNLQKELAKSIQKLLEAKEMDDVDSTLEDVKRLVEDSNIPELTETMRFRTMKGIMLNNWAKNQADRLGGVPEIENIIEHNRKVLKAEGSSEHRRKFFPPRRPENRAIPSLKLKPTKKDRKRELEKILVQEDDGQIGLIMPKEEMVEKQITGQLNIEDILREWERQKNNEENEREKKALEEARSKALNETQEFMSQVMDLLNQYLPKIGETDGRLWSLTTHLKKVQQALNSTDDLSEISKLNNELAETLDKIIPAPKETGIIEDKPIVQEEVYEENIQEEIAGDDSKPEEFSESEQISNKDDEESSEQIADNIFVEEDIAEDNTAEMEAAASLNEDEGLENENIDNEQDVLYREEIEPQENEEESTDEKLYYSEEAEEDLDEENLSKMMDEALHRIAMEVQESAVENEDTSSDEIEEEYLRSEEDDDAADDIEQAIEEGLPEIAEAISEEDKEVELFEEEEEEVNLQDTASIAKRNMEAILAVNNGKDNGLTQKQKEAFSYFASFEKIVTQMNQILNEEKTGKQNMIITGSDGCGKTSLAIRIIKAQEPDKAEENKRSVAKIKGTSLNSYDLEEVFKTVEGGVLIIEKAVALSDNTMTKINNKLNEGANVQIILTTKKKSVERLRTRNPEFMDRFKVFIEVPPYTNNELVEYGRIYARAKGYHIEDMAMLALFSRLGNFQSGKGALTFNEVKEVIDEAIVNAERRNNKLFKRLFGKKNEKSDLLLLEEDFEDN